MGIQNFISIPNQKIIFITAPSGTGKTTLIRNLVKVHPNLCFCVSHTSREKRNEEINAKDYYFVSSAEFEKMIKEEKFLEWVNLSGTFYGTSWGEIERKISQNKILILDIDVQGALYWMPRYKSGLFIFLSPPSLEILEKRLRDRKTEDEFWIQQRLSRSQKEISYKEHWEHIIIGESVEDSLSKVENLIKNWIG